LLVRRFFATAFENDYAQRKRCPQGDQMANYFLFGAIGPLLAPDLNVTCHKCGHACTVEVAVTTALKSGVVKKLSDHRVVQGS
jgi:hypothetical protein